MNAHPPISDSNPSEKNVESLRTRLHALRETWVHNLASFRPRLSAAEAHHGALRDAIAVTCGLLVLVVVGSGGLAHFDVALTGYFVATVVACFSMTYQVARFWRRRPSAYYGRALLRALLEPRQLREVLKRGGRDVATQQFIARRGLMRWGAHMLLAWGTLLSFALTLPLVFGWLHFVPVGERTYQVVAFSIPQISFSIDSLFGWVIFNALNLTAVAVVVGSVYFIAVRMRLRGVVGMATLFHIAPLLLLLVVALTGLALPITSHSGFPGLYRAAAIAHQAVVVLMLLSIPYGKLLHVFIRPLHLGAQMVRARMEDADPCVGCGAPLAPAAQIEAVEKILSARGFRFGGRQRICPTCRRRSMARTHCAILDGQFQPKRVSTHWFRTEEAA